MGSLYISVIVPVFKQPNLVPLLTCLFRQSYPKNLFEIIICDDGSPESCRLDETRIQHQFPSLSIRVVQSTRNRGPAAARNTGIMVARGALLFFTDDDCRPPADWIEQHVHMYRRYPHISAVGGWYSEAVEKIPTCPYQTFLHVLYLGMNTGTVDIYSSVAASPDTPYLSRFPVVNTANLSVRTAVALALRGFDERFPTPGYEDVEFMARVRRGGCAIMHIPYLMPHDKPISFAGFLRFCRNRAIGRYVLDNITKAAHTTTIVEIFNFYRHPERHECFQQISTTRRLQVFILVCLYCFHLHNVLSRWRSARILSRRGVVVHGY